ncbi:prepilin-type N-terminal cleavage/methylation domain-containing protein [Synechocystis salina LEGE 06155]|nr:prepilin-type N-terminal cleavage/methylation domain-containing protein [Synechocystis salina LEGE 06155]
MPPLGFYSSSGLAMSKSISHRFRPHSALLWNLVRQFPSPHDKSDGDGDRGFTMFEVLIALMISFLFLTGTLNAMVMATVMRVKAERQAQAGYWIKEDLERIRSDADAFSDISNCPNVGTNYVTTGTMAANDGIPPMVTSTKTILGRNATMTRTVTASGNVVTLNYIVRNTEITDVNKNILASLYTEVLPAAALNCP